MTTVFFMRTLFGVAKSVTYFETFPLSSAAAISSSLTTKSREKFRIFTPSFIFAKVSAFSMSLLDGIAGTCTVM